MAQQKNNSNGGADFFSHDIDMRNDIKVKALRRKFHHTGYAVWCFMLEYLTDCTNFEMEYTEVTQELLAADFDVPVEELREIIEYSVKIGLLQQQDGKVFSTAHKRRFERMLEVRQRKAEAARRNGRKGGNPNFKKGQPNPYYNTTESVMSDNPEITQDNPSIVEQSSAEQSGVDNTPIIPKGNNLPPVIRMDNRQAQCSCDTTSGERCKRYATWKIGEVFYCNQHAKDIMGDLVDAQNPKRFKAPSVEEVRAYAQEKGYRIDPEHFVDYYTSNGWKVGRNPMKDWRATVRTWASRDKAQSPVQGSQSLGVGEFINNKGIRTYGSSGQPVPQDAPPRPSDAHYWSETTGRWEKTI